MKKSGPKTKADRRKISAERLMQNVAFNLLGDFRKMCDDPIVGHDYVLALSTLDIPALRRHTDAINPVDGDAPHLFKMKYQLKSLMKRFRFDKDLYTLQELEAKSVQTFLETQERISGIDLHSSPLIGKILDRAATYIQKVLGVYDEKEHRDLCKFGKRASVGVPGRLACEAARWELPLTGSPDQIDWFHEEIHGNESVLNYWAFHCSDRFRKDMPLYQPVDQLKLTLVPKTFKSLRSIMPNTTIGSYMSFGLGEMIRRRLKSEGYDIKTLQQRHKSLARKASIDSKMTTADLSSASDSISVALVERLFPRDWLSVLTKSRIGKVVLPNDQVVESCTFSTMGVGYTFPLQMLVFLALLHAIQATLINRSEHKLISVYGDDLIYSGRMHKYVVSVFTQIGFVINIDKTFHEGNFRESCGGDYYCGKDVRPFQPESGQAKLFGIEYEAMLYKFINGLLYRWTEHEISGTLKYLTSELEAIANLIKVVPCDYPDDAGVQCAAVGCWDFLQHAQVFKPIHIGHGLYRFRILRSTSKIREEKRHEPYYWRALSGDFGQDHYDSCPTLYRRVVSPLARLLHLAHGTDCATPILIAENTVTKLTDSSIKRRNRRFGKAVTTSVVVPLTGRYTCQRAISCFETPQTLC